MGREIAVTYIGGPTVLLEIEGVRFLTDPTFDEAGGEYTTGPVTLKKLAGPAIAVEALEPFDYVLLSHDHHFDNLDHGGRAALARAKSVFMTREGAARLGGNSIGLRDWEEAVVPTPSGGELAIVATPARHGPEGLDRGAVNGFVVRSKSDPACTVYITGDTVWYNGVSQVAKRFRVGIVFLHMGAARVPQVGPFHLTMTAEEGVTTALEFPEATIVPIHFEDWAHFSQTKEDVAHAFANAHLEGRLRWPVRGETIRVPCEGKTDFTDSEQARASLFEFGGGERLASRSGRIFLARDDEKRA